MYLWLKALTLQTNIEELTAMTMQYTMLKLGRHMLNDGPMLANDRLPGWCATAFIDQVKKYDREVITSQVQAQAHNNVKTVHSWDFYLIITNEIHHHVSQKSTS